MNALERFTLERKRIFPKTLNELGLDHPHTMALIRVPILTMWVKKIRTVKIELEGNPFVEDTADSGIEHLRDVEDALEIVIGHHEAFRDVCIEAKLITYIGIVRQLRRDPSDVEAYAKAEVLRREIEDIIPVAEVVMS